jgi:hypothetical protein
LSKNDGPVFFVWLVVVVVVVVASDTGRQQHRHRLCPLVVILERKKMGMHALSTRSQSYDF